MSEFTIGNQPCLDYKPTRDIYGANVHECFCPFIDGQPKCGKQVSFCENCHTDHHENGSETCLCAEKKQSE